MARSKPTSTKRQRDFDKKRKKQEKLEKKRNKKVEKNEESSNPDPDKKDVGKRVISLDFGVGVISSIETLDESHSEKYYVIEHGNKRSRNLYPVNGNRGMRFLSTKESFLRSLNVMKERMAMCQIFKSKKHRLEYFKNSLLTNRTETIVERVIELNNIRDISPVERNIFDKLVNTLAIESVIVLNIKKNESQGFVLSYLNLVNHSCFK